MATKKQQRRRFKEKRHEYVWVDPETGEELDEEQRPRPERSRVTGAATKAPAQQAKKGGSRAGREPQPPSWNKVGRRALIFAPLMFVLVMVTSKGGNKIASSLMVAAVMMAIFLPFSYVMDGVVYRNWQKKQARAQGERKPGERRK
jgi:uncharacterized membrane protein YebE (DUF533 family)